MAERSKELIQVGYYLSKYGQYLPPKKLETDKLKAIHNTSPLFSNLTIVVGDEIVDKDIINTHGANNPNA